MAIAGTIAWEIGIASSRFSWSMVRSATIRAAVRPDAEPLAHDLDVGVHVRRVGAKALQPGLQPLRGVGRLELGELGQHRLRPVDLVDLAEPVHGSSSSATASSPTIRSMSRVIRSSTGSPSTGIAGASRPACSMSARSAARPAGPGSSRRSS